MDDIRHLFHCRQRTYAMVLVALAVFAVVKLQFWGAAAAALWRHGVPEAFGGAFAPQSTVQALLQPMAVWAFSGLLGIFVAGAVACLALWAVLGRVRDAGLGEDWGLAVFLPFVLVRLFHDSQSDAVYVTGLGLTAAAMLALAFIPAGSFGPAAEG